MGEEQPFVVEDLLSGQRLAWRGAHATVNLDPGVQVAHVLAVHPGARSERDFETYQ